jgi:hypothetical protein
MHESFPQLFGFAPLLYQIAFCPIYLLARGLKMISGLPKINGTRVVVALYPLLFAVQ